MSRIRPNVIKLQAALDGCRCETGMTHADLVSATGLLGAEVSDALRWIRRSGGLFALGSALDKHYFADSMELENGRRAVEEKLASVKIDRKIKRIARQKEYWADPARLARKAELRRAKDAEKRAARAPKPKKQKVVHLVIAKPARPQKPGWAPESPAHIPEHVKVQVLPGYDGDRWKVQAPEDGFAAEGKRLYGGAK
jgi:hypothetical protein